MLTFTRNGSELSGISNGVLSLTVSDNSTICLVALAPNDSRCVSKCDSSFVEPVGVYVGPRNIPLTIADSLSRDSRVCGTLPPLANLCDNAPSCMSRGASFSGLPLW